MQNIPEHPDVARALRTGYPYEYEEHTPICPKCGSEPSFFYLNSFNDIIGCEWCIKEVDAWEWDDEHREG